MQVRGRPAANFDSSSTRSPVAQVSSAVSYSVLSLNWRPAAAGKTHLNLIQLEDTDLLGEVEG